MQQVKPEQRGYCWLGPCIVVIVPHANIKGSTLASHITKLRMACHQEGEDDGTIPIMGGHNWTPWQQHDFFAMKDYINDLATPIFMSPISTNIHQIWGNMPRLYGPPELCVCAKGGQG
jgi:hypothetical protein